MDQLKQQIMTMMAVKSVGQPQSQGNDMTTFLYTLVVMTLIDYIFKHAPAIATWFQEQAKSRVKLPDMVTNAISPSQSSVKLIRVYGNDSSKKQTENNVYVERVDAVLDYICSLDVAQHVRLENRYMITNEEEIVLTPLIRAKVKETHGSDQNATVQVLLYSDVLKISDLRAWIDEIYAGYVSEKANRLGNKIYYFNEIQNEPPKVLDPETKKKVYRMEQAPKHLVFAMNEFRTSKSFDNVYGSHVAELKERLDLFVNHPEWYMERGIPHSLGVLLHGKPGAGKTSTIKAIAHDTNRHIFNLSLREFTTQKQLTNLFYNETVTVTVDNQPQTYRIPLNKRVYVIEDIDCLTDVVLDRVLYSPGDDDEEKEQENGDRLTLSFLLNLLDGVLETPGRILVITSNYPEKLDRALIRPGRIDVKIEFGNASRDLILDMVNRFYDVEFTLADIPEALDDYFTPAEVMESLCTNFKDVHKAIAHLEGRVATAQAKTVGLLATFMNDTVEEATVKSTTVEQATSTNEEIPQLTITDVNEKTVFAVNHEHLTKRRSSIADSMVVDYTTPMSEMSRHFGTIDTRNPETWVQPTKSFEAAFEESTNVSALFNALQTDPDRDDRLKELRNTFTTLGAASDDGFAPF